MPITDAPTGDFYWQIPATERGLLKELTGAEGVLRDVVAERDKAEVARWSERVAGLWIALVACRPGWMASPVEDAGIGAAVLAGRGPELAAAIRQRLVTDLETLDPLVQPEAEWWSGLALTRVNLRFLERDWRPIDAFPKPGNYLGAKPRHIVNTRQRILTAFFKRDRTRLERSLAALAESAEGEPWLLAWALYREAKKLRMGASVNLLERKPPKASWR